jgi:hypothetical protein
MRITVLGLGGGGAGGGTISPAPLQLDGVLFATGPTTFTSDATNFSWDQTGFRVTTTNGFRSGNGSAATPAFSFSTQTGFGWYRSAAGEMALSDGAGARASYLTSGGDFFLLSDTGTVRIGASSDVFIARGSGGQFRIFTNSTLAVEVSTAQLLQSVGGIQIASTGLLAWSSGAIGATSDVILSRAAANRLQLVNGTAAQRLDIYNTISGGNSEFLSIRWATDCIIEAGITGAGTPQRLLIGTSALQDLVFKVNDVERWRLNDNSGDLIAVTDNTVDIGRIGDARPREIFAATGYRGPSDVAGFSGTVTPVTTITVSGGIITNVA